MRCFLLAGMAIMACLSCTKDIVLNVNRGAAIDFTVAAHTRAHETTTSNLETFYVTAVDPRQANNYFTDVAYIKSGEIFHSSPTYYWPGDGSELDFYAYAPSATDLGASVSIDRGAQRLIDYSPAADISQQHDFITATTTQGRMETSVPLEFRHALSQIEVRAKNTDGGHIYKVKGVRIAQVASKGSYDFNSGQWTLGDEKEVYEVTYGDARVLDEYGVNLMMEQGDNAMLIPQQLVRWDAENDRTNVAKGAYISVCVNITTSSGAAVYPLDKNEYAWLAVGIGTDWQAGNRYIYTLDFTRGAGFPDPTTPDIGNSVFGDEIHFDVDVSDWNETVDVENTFLLGQWYFHDSMMIISQDGKIQDRRWFNSFELAQTLNMGVNSIYFESNTLASIIIGGDLVYTEVESRDGKLYLSFDGLPENISVIIVPDYTAGVLNFELSFMEMGLLYTQKFTFSRNRNVEGERWKENFCGTWGFQYYETTCIYDNGTETSSISTELENDSPMDVLIVSHERDSRFKINFEGVGNYDTFAEPVQDEGFLWKPMEGLSFYITDITSDTMSFYRTRREDGVYIEEVAYYTKIN